MGWSETALLWELPAARFWQYWHCLLASEGRECYWPAGSEMGAFAEQCEAETIKNQTAWKADDENELT